MVELVTLMCVARWAVMLAMNAIRARRAGAPLPRLKPTLLDAGILGLVGIGLLSSLQSEFKVEAFREWRLVMVEPALLYLMLRSSGLSDERRNGIAAAFVAGGIGIAAIGLWNYARGIRFEAEFGLPRIQSVYGSANNDALYLERAWAIALAGVVFGRWALQAVALPGGRILRAAWLSGAARGAAILGLGLMTVALALTQSRGAILFGLPAALVAMCFAAGGRWRWLGAALLAVTVAGAGLLLSGAAATLLQGTRFATALNLSVGSGFIRVNLWQSAWAMWLDHPLLGVGPDNFLYAYRSFYILPAAWKEPELSHAHNLILDPLARIGALGLIALAAVAAGFVARARAALRNVAARPLVIGALGLAAAAAAHGMVDHSFFLPDLAYAFMIAAGLIAGEDLSAN
jgi:O-antigen ligase